MMINDLYVYEDNIYDNLDELEMYIAGNCTYAGEEGLMNIFENEIELIGDINDLINWCIENYTTVEELLESGLQVFSDG